MLNLHLSSFTLCLFFFFFNDTATTEIYTLSLHDALPIYVVHRHHATRLHWDVRLEHEGDRKSTRLNSSHVSISYAVFCLKKKKKNQLQKRRANKSLHFRRKARANH